MADEQKTQPQQNRPSRIEGTPVAALHFDPRNPLALSGQREALTSIRVTNSNGKRTQYSIEFFASGPFAAHHRISWLEGKIEAVRYVHASHVSSWEPA